MTVPQTEKQADQSVDNSLHIQIIKKLKALQISQRFIDYCIECLQNNVILPLDNWKALTPSQKDTYPGTFKVFMNEMATEMDHYHTFSLFETNVKEGLRRSGCSDNCHQLSMSRSVEQSHSRE
jgi:hypothetical protein